MAKEAIELHEKIAGDGGNHTPVRITAAVVAVLAVFLAIVTLLADHATVQTLLSQSKANDTWNNYTTVIVQRHIDTDISGMLRAMAPGDNNAKELRREADKLDLRIRNEHESSLVAMRQHALDLEHERDRAETDHHTFLYAETGLEVAVVLASVSALLDVSMLLYAGVAVGILSAILAGLGVFTHTPLPF